MKTFYLVLFAIAISCGAAAQNVGIGTNTPNASAQLDITSSSKGVLLPRMSTTQRNSIVSPATGLMILNTDDLCNDVYDGSKWVKNCGLKQGDSTTVPANNWISKPDFGGVPRNLGVGFSIGTKAYIGTGDDGVTLKNDFWEYNPATNAWLQKANFSGAARYVATGFAIGSKGYLGTGFDGVSNKNDFWEYDPSTNAWTQKANFAGTARLASTGLGIGVKGYIGLGNDGTNKNDFWEFDPGVAGSLGTWSSKANFAGGARVYAAGFSIGSYGYIGTGLGASSSFNDFWEYNPATNAWTQRAALVGEARYGAAGFSIGTKGYIGIGRGSLYKKDFWEYNTEVYQVASYSTSSNTLAQSNISDGIWTKTVLGVIQSNGAAVLIDPTGNVGIGTTAPAQKLDVGGNLRAGSPGNAQAMIGNNASGTNNVVGFWRSGFNYILSTDGNYTSLTSGIGDLFLKTNNVDRVFVGYNGNVGIGTISPAQKLHVAGNICYTGTIGACSDIRYKTNITSLTNALSTVLSLHPFYYNWKKEFIDQGFPDERYVGFSAQEVEKMFPELVQTNEDGYKAVDYGRLTPILVQAIKEQQKQIEELKSNASEKENHLQQQMDDLKQQLQSIMHKSINKK